MKKLILLFAAVAVFAACSSDDDAAQIQEDSAVKLVDATVNVNMSKSVSRAYLGNIDSSNNIDQNLEQNDELYVIDYAGEHPFKVTEGGTNGIIKGQWAELKDGKNGIVAMFPKAAFLKSITVAENKPTMYFKLPDTQVSRNREGSKLSYDPAAGLSFACADNKTDGLWFMSVCSYLYFYSKSETAQIKSNNQNIGGNITLTYTGSLGTGKTGYNTLDELKNYMQVEASAQIINCKGIVIADHQNKFNDDYKNAYEYMIAIKPGTYNIGELSVVPANNEGKKNKEQLVMQPGGVYYLGCADKQ